MEAIEENEMPDDFCPPPQVEALYTEPPVPESDDPETLRDRDIDRAAVWKEFAGAGHKTIAEANRLTIKENEELSRSRPDTVSGSVRHCVWSPQGCLKCSSIGTMTPGRPVLKAICINTFVLAASLFFATGSMKFAMRGYAWVDGAPVQPDGIRA